MRRSSPGLRLAALILVSDKTTVPVDITLTMSAFAEPLVPGDAFEIKLGKMDIRLIPVFGEEEGEE